MRYIKLFENFEAEKPKSKSQIRRELWAKNNPAPEGKILDLSDLSQYEIPPSILKMMKSWPLIFKSPYSNSFYSSDQITWSSKPDKTYRVSNHWNFISRNKIHCRTAEPVKNNTHISIGVYDKKSGLYKILLSEPTEQHKRDLEKANYVRNILQNPEVIQKKKEFKERIKNGEIFAEFTLKGNEYKGKVDKYTGPGGTMRILDDENKVVFSGIYFDSKDLKLFDKYGEIENPYEFQ